MVLCHLVVAFLGSIEIMQAVYNFEIFCQFLLCIYFQEQVNKVHDSDVSSLSQSIIWIWSGSRYSGLLCASLSSIFYFAMEVLMGVFSGW